jgi:hypothetical protein
MGVLLGMGYQSRVIRVCLPIPCSEAAGQSYNTVGWKQYHKATPFRYWLKEETVMLEDYWVPLGEDGKKIIPFLKQRNFLIENQINTYLSAGELTNGLVYFEQERSTGDRYPYLEPDMKVQTKVIVYDTKGNSWETEMRVTKVKIEPIREICPKFGKTRELSEN